MKTFHLFTLLTLLSLPVLGQKAKVTLTWDPVPETNVAYRVYWGASSRGYTNFQNSPGITNTVANLRDGATYYFAVTAYSLTSGLESDYSNEVVITTSGDRPSAPGGVRGAQVPDVVWRGKTNANGTITPIADLQLGGPVTVVAEMWTNGVLMNTRTVSTTTGLATITGSRSLARPFSTSLRVTKITYDPLLAYAGSYQ